MKSKFLLLLLILPLCSMAQRARVSLLINSTAGCDFTLKGISSGNEIRNLIYFDNTTPYLRLSASLFFGERFGITAAYQGSLNAQFNSNAFNSQLEQKYPDYYTYFPSTNENTGSQSFGNVTSKILTGITYNFEYKKLRFIPKLMTGFTILNASDGEVYLKKKESNEYLHETYKKSDDASTAIFCINGGINVVWMVKERLGLNLELNYFENWMPQGSFVYTVTTTNAYTGEETKQTIDHAQSIRQLSVGAGFCVYLKKSSRVKSITDL